MEGISTLNLQEDAFSDQNMRQRFDGSLNLSRQAQYSVIPRNDRIEVRDYRTNTTVPGVYQIGFRFNDNGLSYDHWWTAERDMPDAGLLETMNPEADDPPMVAVIDGPKVALANWLDRRQHALTQTASQRAAVELAQTVVPIPENLSEINRLPAELQWEIEKRLEAILARDLRGDIQQEKGYAAQGAKEWNIIADFYAGVLIENDDDIFGGHSRYHPRHVREAMQEIFDALIAERKGEKR